MLSHQQKRQKKLAHASSSLLNQPTCGGKLVGMCPHPTLTRSCMCIRKAKYMSRDEFAFQQHAGLRT
jgi:hypothetical protein